MRKLFFRYCVIVILILMISSLSVSALSLSEFLRKLFGIPTEQLRYSPSPFPSPSPSPYPSQTPTPSPTASPTASASPIIPVTSPTPKPTTSPTVSPSATPSQTAGLRKKEEQNIKISELAKKDSGEIYRELAKLSDFTIQIPESEEITAKAKKEEERIEEKKVVTRIVDIYEKETDKLIAVITKTEVEKQEKLDIKFSWS